jgi:hypothetical protein
MAALATGGWVERIELSPRLGGACYCPGGNAFLTLSAGYLGSLAWGALILEAGQRAGSRAHRVVQGLGAGVLLLTLLYVRGVFGFLFGVLFGSASSWRPPPLSRGQSDPPHLPGAHQRPLCHPGHQGGRPGPPPPPLRRLHAGPAHRDPHPGLGSGSGSGCPGGLGPPLPPGPPERLRRLGVVPSCPFRGVGHMFSASPVGDWAGPGGVQDRLPRTAGLEPAGATPDVDPQKGGDPLSSPSSPSSLARASDRRIGR